MACLEWNVLACFFLLQLSLGSAIHASILPVDPVLRVGDSLTLSCTLDQADDVTNRTARAILWTKGSTQIASARYVARNATTSQLRLHNVTVDDDGKYYCQFADDEWMSRRGVHVFVGLPPEPVENVTCVAPTLTSFRCKWDHRHGASNLAVTDTLQFKPWSSGLDWETCKLSGSARCDGECQKCDGMDIRVISTNILGNSSYSATMDYTAIVRPDPVRNIVVTAPEPHCLNITWDWPAGWSGEITLYLACELRYREISTNLPAHARWNKVQPMPMNTAHMICDLRSHALYEVAISTWYAINFEELTGVWSRAVSSRTMATEPSAAPRNLTLNVTSEDPTWIDVKWLPVGDLYQNGVITSYTVYSCMVNSSQPETVLERSVSASTSELQWTSELCIGDERAGNFSVPAEQDDAGWLEYTLQNTFPGHRYIVWVTANNSAGEGSPTHPSLITVPVLIPDKPRGRTGAVIVSVITICQVLFIVGLGLCCWQVGFDLFKRNRRLPQPYIPPDVLSLKQEALTPRAPCPGEFFDEIPGYRNKSYVDDHLQTKPLPDSNSGCSSVDHGFYDMQSSGSSGGSSLSSSTTSHYNSSHYHNMSTMRCKVGPKNHQQLVLMTDPNTGYSVATCLTDDIGGIPIPEMPQESGTKCGSDYDEDDDGYIKPNEIESTEVMNKHIRGDSLYDKPSRGRPINHIRLRYSSDQSDTTTASSILSDQGFGSAESDPESRQASPTQQCSPMFQEFPTKLEALLSLPEASDSAEYFCIDEIESICSSRKTAPGRSGNRDEMPYRLPMYPPSYWRKSEVSHKSSGSESESYAGYMFMATMEESSTDYGYIGHDSVHSGKSTQQTDLSCESPQERNVDEYDTSQLVFTYEVSDLPPDVSPTDTRPSHDTNKVLAIDGPQNEMSSSRCLPAFPLSSSPPHTCQQDPKDTDRSEPSGNCAHGQSASETVRPSSVSTSSVDCYVTEQPANCGSTSPTSSVVNPYVSHTDPIEACSGTIVSTQPRIGPSLSGILFSDPVSGYVSNAVFT